MDASFGGDDRPSALGRKCTADERSVICRVAAVWRNGLRYFALRLHPRTVGAATVDYGDEDYGDSRRKLVGPPLSERPLSWIRG
jgi:hypothetical protein